MPNPDKVVGHKTFYDHGKFRHEPLLESEAKKIMARVKKAERIRKKKIPDERAAINALFEATVRLCELGWSEAIYCPKDGSCFDALEIGSTGIHKCRYSGEWPNGSWWSDT